MFAIVILYLVRRNDGVDFHIFVPHCRHNHFFGLELSKFPKSKSLSLQRSNKGVAIAVEVLANNILYPLVEVVIGNLVAFFFERLNDALAVDQILEGFGARLLDFVGKLLAPILVAQKLFLWGGHASHLGIGDDIIIDDGGDAINDFGFSG